MTDAPFWEGDWENAEREAAEAEMRMAAKLGAPVILGLFSGFALHIGVVALGATGAVLYPDPWVRAGCAAVAAWQWGRFRHISGQAKVRKEYDLQPKPLPRPSWKRRIRSGVLIGISATAAGAGLTTWFTPPVAVGIAVACWVGEMAVGELLRQRAPMVFEQILPMLREKLGKHEHDDED